LLALGLFCVSIFIAYRVFCLDLGDWFDSGWPQRLRILFMVVGVATTAGVARMN